MKLLVFASVMLFLVLSGFPADLHADTVYLKNGRSITGIIKNEDANSVELDVGFGIVKFEKNQIERVYKSTSDEKDAIEKEHQRQELEREKAVEKGRLRQEIESAAQNARQEQRLKEEEEGRGRRPKSVGISEDLGHITVDVLLNKKVPVSLLLDTGASTIVLSRNVARRLGIDIGVHTDEVELQVADGSKIKARFVLLDSVSVQGMEAKYVESALLLEDIKDLPFQDGVLGMSFLKRFNFKIDNKNKKLILEKLE